MASSFHADENERIRNTLILDDSLTSILSQKKMCEPNLQIKIKSHTGASLQDIHNTIIKWSKPMMNSCAIVMQL